MSTEVFMVKIVMLTKMTLCRLLFVVRVSPLLSVCEFGADLAKSTVCELLSHNSFDEVCEGLEIVLSPCTLSE